MYSTLCSLYSTNYNVSEENTDIQDRLASILADAGYAKRGDLHFTSVVLKTTSFKRAQYLP